MEEEAQGCRLFWSVINLHHTDKPRLHRLNDALMPCTQRGSSALMLLTLTLFMSPADGGGEAKA